MVFSMQALAQVKIWGLPRTCTNAVERALLDNFAANVLTNKPDFKHGPKTYEGDGGHKHIVCVRHPIQWLFGFWRWEQHYYNGTIPFHQFPFIPCKTYPEETPCAAFNRLIGHWLTMLDDPGIVQVVRQEDMATQQLSVLKRLQAAFDLTPLGTLSPVRDRVAPYAKLTPNAYVLEKMTFPPQLEGHLLMTFNPWLVAASGYGTFASHILKAQREAIA